MTVLRVGSEGDARGLWAESQSEAEIQSAAVDLLRASGFEVEVTSERRRRCAGCGAWSHSGSGVTKGVPDVLVRHPSWPTALRVVIEMKRPKGVLSQAQSDALRRRGIFVARSADEALRIAQRTSELLSDLSCTGVVWVDGLCAGVPDVGE